MRVMPSVVRKYYTNILWRHQMCTLNFLSPCVSILCITVLIGAIPLWFTILAVPLFIETQVFITLILYSMGGLQSESIMLTTKLFSLQVKMIAKQRGLCHGKHPLLFAPHVRQLIMISLAIREASSTKRPLCFCLPDGTPLTPATAGKCFMESLSFILLSLSNNLINL